MSKISDASAISTYLSNRLGTDSVDVTNVTRHTGGWSMDTVSFSLSRHDGSNSTEERLVIRAENDTLPGANTFNYCDTRTEFEALSEAETADVPVPETYWYEDDPSHLGSQFFVMEYCQGEPPNLWSSSDRQELYGHWEDSNRDLPRQFVRAAAGIHAMDPDNIDSIEAVSPDEVAEREVNRLEHRYEQNVVLDEPIVREAFSWLRRHRPDVPEVTVIHGDFRLGNMLLDNGDINAVIDWERTRAGDPAFDLALTSLEFHAGKLMTDPERPELANALVPRTWLRDQYEDHTGRNITDERLQFWSVFALVRIITSCMTGIKRFKDGTTKDVRSIWFEYMIPGLIESLQNRIQSDRISR